MLALDNVFKTYVMGETEVRALRGVSLQIPSSCFAVIMGHSGSGKSTLLHLAGSLDVPTSGTVVFRGRDISGLSSRERADLRATELGFVFQKYNLVGNLTALQNVSLPLLLRRVSARVAQDRAMKALAQVGLRDRVGHRPSKLSGGEQQRVAIARALVNDPIMVLADEPTGNLDSQTGQDVLAMLKGLAEQDKTVLVVTHNPEIGRLAAVLVVLRDGSVEAETRQEVNA